MSIERIAIDVFRLRERAELLAAIYGDGAIERRGQKGRRVGVAVSDDWPRWYARVPELFLVVFGRYMWCERGSRKNGTGDLPPPPSDDGFVRNYEFYLTTHDTMAVFGVSEKYDEQHWIKPPDWVTQDPECLRRFVLGLVETDGCFSLDKNDGTPSFTFSQTNDYLSAWFTQTVRGLGFDCNMSYGEAAGANQPRIGKSDDVRRFGEWLQSEKWLALVTEGWMPRPSVVDRKRGGIPIQARKAIVLKSVSESDQNGWRALRTRGASISAIARHVGRSNSVIDSVVCDIVPVAARSAEDLGLVPTPHFPRGTSATAEPVASWRRRALAGEATQRIQRDYPTTSEAAINSAVCDIRWEQLKERRVIHERRLERMKSSAQGHGRWRDVPDDVK